MVFQHLGTFHVLVGPPMLGFFRFHLSPCLQVGSSPAPLQFYNDNTVQCDCTALWVHCTISANGGMGGSNLTVTGGVVRIMMY